MKYIILTLLTILNLNANAEVKFKFKTDAPKFSRTLDLGPSENIEDKDRHKNLKCEVFPEFVLLTMLDPGLKGTGYQILPRKNKGVKISDLCSNVSEPKEFTFWGGTVEGVIGSVIVYKSEEPLGNLDHLTFYDVKKEKTLFSAAFNTGAPLQIEKSARSISIKYEAYLDYPTPRCNAVEDNDGSCLKSILKKNVITQSKGLGKVDCTQAIQENTQDAKIGSVHLFIETQVKNIEHPMKKVTGKKIVCVLSP
jgi:hypothetical protein